MDREQALELLPEADALALRQVADGAGTAVRASQLEIEHEPVPLLLRVAEDELATLDGQFLARADKVAGVPADERSPLSRRPSAGLITAGVSEEVRTVGPGSGPQRGADKRERRAEASGGGRVGGCRERRNTGEDGNESCRTERRAEAPLPRRAQESDDVGLTLRIRARGNGSAAGRRLRAG